MGVIAYKDKFYAGSIEDGWKQILDNTIPSDAEEIKVVAYSNGEVAQAVFDTYTFGSDWKWYIINGYYASSNDNVRVITQFKQGAIGAKLFYVNGSAKTAIFDYYYRKASSYIGLADNGYPPKKAIITLTFTNGQATTSDYVNNVILAAEIAGNTITYEPTLASGSKTGYKFVARTSTMAIDTGFSGQKNLTIVFV